MPSIDTYIRRSSVWLKVRSGLLTAAVILALVAIAFFEVVGVFAIYTWFTS